MMEGKKKKLSPKILFISSSQQSHNAEKESLREQNYMKIAELLDIFAGGGEIKA